MKLGRLRRGAHVRRDLGVARPEPPERQGQARRSFLRRVTWHGTLDRVVIQR